MSADEVVTKEEMEQLNKDIESTKQALGAKVQQDAIDKAKETAKAEAHKEFELAGKLAEQERLNKELQAKIDAQQKATTEQLTNLQKKVEETLTSRAVINNKNPYSTDQTPIAQTIDTWNDDKVTEVEEASGRAFFGDEYDGLP